MKCIPAFRAAVEQALKADTGVVALIAQRVFSVVPPTTTITPWVYVGGVVATQERTACGSQWTVQLRICAAQTDFDPDVVWAVLAAVSDALDGKSLTMPDGTAQTLPIEIGSVGDIVDPQQPANAFLDLTAMVAG